MRGLRLLLLVFGLLWLGGAATAQSQVTPNTTKGAEQAVAAEPESEEGWSGFSVFLLVFIISILFVASTATALNNMGGKAPPKRPGKPRPKSTATGRKLPQGRDRFKL